MEAIRQRFAGEIESAGANGGMGAARQGTFVVRTYGGDPSALAQTLRREIPRKRSEFRVSSARTQTEIVESQTLRERLLARLALLVALLLAGIGLYGVLTTAVFSKNPQFGLSFFARWEALESSLGFAFSLLLFFAYRR